MDKDTLTIAVAEHGHTNAEYIESKNHPDITASTKKNIYIENRCPMFKIYEGKEQSFKELSEKHFGEYFYLIPKEEIKNYKIFDI